MTANINKIVAENQWLLNEFVELANQNSRFQRLKTVPGRFLYYLYVHNFPILKHILFYDCPVSMLKEMLKNESPRVRKIANLVYMNLEFFRKILCVDYVASSLNAPIGSQLSDDPSQYETPPESMTEFENNLSRNPSKHSTLKSVSAAALRNEINSKCAGNRKFIVLRKFTVL